MSVIDLGSSTEFEIVWSGKSYKLREPTAREMNDYQKTAKADSSQDQSLDLLIGFLEKLGMPKDVLESMPMSKINRMVDAIISSISKKN